MVDAEMPPSSAFRGVFQSDIRCLHVPCHSSRSEDFVDVSVDVLEDPNNDCGEHDDPSKCVSAHHATYDTLEKSLFRLFLRESALVNENAYDTGTAEFGIQDAQQIIRLDRRKLPPSLMIHLKRFKYVQDAKGRWGSKKVSYT
jgi:hypothetical protein